MATKSATPAKKKTTKKAATKKTAAKKKTTTKKATPAKPAAKKKTPVKKAPAKKTAAKKTTPAKKTTTAKKATAKKPAAKKTVKTTAKKATPTKKAAPVKKTATKKTAAKTTAKKPAVKKTTAAKKKATPPPPPKPKPANVGQAPRKTTTAASIPTPTAIPPREAPQADKAASIDAAASSAAKQDFKVKDKIVYPAHGVGRIAGLEKQEVAGIPIELFIIDFEQEKMKLRVPTGKAKAAGMRPLSSDDKIKDAINTLKGRARIKRTMWSRRAQEYDAKINSGDIILVAEVVRDLFRAADQPEQSYSERQLFEAALDRMAREVAAVKKVDLGAAIAELDETLRNRTPAAT